MKCVGSPSAVFSSSLSVFVSIRLPAVRGPSSSPEGADKKRESRRSGFFNLIKSRTSRSEKSHGAASITPPPPAASATSTSISTVPEETTPTSPVPPPVKPVAAAAEPHREIYKAPTSNHTGSDTEAPQTSTQAAADKKTEEKNVETKGHLETPAKKENPHIPRHMGVPVMGMDLLAEMKARQEKRAGKKVGGVLTADVTHGCQSTDHQGSLCFQSDSAALDKVDGNRGESLDLLSVLRGQRSPFGTCFFILSAARSDVHPTVPADTEESKPEPSPRSKQPNTSPKPAPPQDPKPPLSPRTSGPLSPVTFRLSSPGKKDREEPGDIKSSSSPTMSAVRLCVCMPVTHDAFRDPRFSLSHSELCQPLYFMG